MLSLQVPSDFECVDLKDFGNKNIFSFPKKFQFMLYEEDYAEKETILFISIFFAFTMSLFFPAKSFAAIIFNSDSVV